MRNNMKSLAHKPIKFISDKFKNFTTEIFPPVHYLKSLEIKKEILKNYASCDKILFDAVSNSSPSLIGRIGGTEARVLGCLVDLKFYKSKFDPLAMLYSAAIYHRRVKQLQNGAGIFPITNESMSFFLREYSDAFLNSDIFGCWGHASTWSENYFLKNKVLEQIIVPHMSTAPWIQTYSDNSSSIEPWSYGLEGKKILVISAFSKSFSRQHKNIHKVFPNNYYPKFDPIFIQSPMTQGGGKGSWIAELGKIKETIRDLDFEVALISAGGYALPIANYVKSLGKIGVNCGGELQLFFGVLGKRWDHSAKHQKYFNSNWIRPDTQERPNNWMTIENGCYW